MKKKTVTIEFEIPDEISDKDFEEWVEFELGWDAGCSGKKPFAKRILCF